MKKYFLSLFFLGFLVLPHLVSAQLSATPVVGTKKVGAILFNFKTTAQIKGDVSALKQKIQDQLFGEGSSLKNYFNEVSYGNLNLMGRGAGGLDVYGPVTLTVDTPICELTTATQVVEAAKLAAKKALVPVDDYDYLYFFSELPAAQCNKEWGFDGMYATKNYVWVKLSPLTIDGVTRENYSLRTMAHELGHAFGLGHSNSLYCTQGGEPVALAQNCGVISYGNPFDLMGDGINLTDISAFFKVAIGWLPKTKAQTITKNGTYFLAPLESKSSEVQLLRIPVSGYANYQYLYLQYRIPIGMDSHYSSSYFPSDPLKGVFLFLGGDYDYARPNDFNPELTFSGEVLINTHPQLLSRIQESNTFLTSALRVGEEFIYPFRPITVKVLNLKDSGATVAVTLGSPVSLLTPNDGQTISGSVPVKIRVKLATSTVATAAKPTINFLVDNQVYQWLVGPAPSSLDGNLHIINPGSVDYELSLDTINRHSYQNGNTSVLTNDYHKLQAVLYDQTGTEIGRSDEITVLVDNRQVRINRPSNGATLEPGLIPVSVAVLARPESQYASMVAEPTPTKAELARNPRRLILQIDGQDVIKQSGTSLNYNWDTSNALGGHVLKAVYTDNRGLTTITSPTVSVKIKNREEKNDSVPTVTTYDLPATPSLASNSTSASSSVSINVTTNPAMNAQGAWPQGTTRVTFIARLTGEAPLTFFGSKDGSALIVPTNACSQGVCQITFDLHNAKALPAFNLENNNALTFSVKDKNSNIATWSGTVWIVDNEVLTHVVTNPGGSYNFALVDTSGGGSANLGNRSIADLGRGVFRPTIKESYRGIGKTSGLTNSVSVLAAPISIPNLRYQVPAPTNLVASAGDYSDKIVLTWTPALNLPATFHYDVYRKGADNTWTYLASVVNPTYIDTTASPNTLYVYRVFSTGQVAGQTLYSVNSNDATGRRTLSTVEVDFSLSGLPGTTNQKGSVAIKASGEAICTQSLNLILSCQYPLGTSQTVTLTADGYTFNPATFTLNNLQLPKYFLVTAKVVAPEINSTPSAQTIIPAPYHLVASDASYTDRITLNWYDPLNRPSGSHYDIYRVRSPGSDHSNWTYLASVNDPWYNDNTAEPGIIYDYRVFLVLGTQYSTTIQDSGLRTPTVSSSPFLGVPTSPALSVSKGTYSDKIQLNWNSVGSGIKYDIYRSLTQEPMERIEVGYDGTTYADTTVLPGTTYYYRLGAVNYNVTTLPRPYAMSNYDTGSRAVGVSQAELDYSVGRRDFGFAQLGSAWAAFHAILGPWTTPF